MQKKMSSEQSVFKSKATYYKTTDKKWISGMFTLKGNKIQFQGDEKNQEFSLLLILNNISGLEKRQSSFIYAAVVIIVGIEKHWFASFWNRDTVYNLLELFWRESLFSVPIRQSPSHPKDASSTLGKDLLSILHESEVTLIDAANALSSQGRQLEESQLLMQDINSDLSAAEKFLKNMSLTQAVIGLKESESKISEEQRVVNEEPRQKSFKVNFSDKGSRINDYEKGTLVITDKIIILDESQNKSLEINNNEVEKILVTSPWAFSLEYSSKWVTKTCHFICPQLAGFLKFLQCDSTLKNKVTYENEAPSDDTATSSSEICKGEIQNSSSIINPIPTENLNSDSAQMQIEEAGNVISDEDMEQISNVLNNLQALATEVSREQHDQMEKINSLISDVDKTGLKINNSNKNIQKNM